MPARQMDRSNREHLESSKELNKGNDIFSKKKHKGNDASPFIDQRATARIRVAGWGRAQGREGRSLCEQESQAEKETQGNAACDADVYGHKAFSITADGRAFVRARADGEIVLSSSREERGKEKRN